MSLDEDDILLLTGVTSSLESMEPMAELWELFFCSLKTLNKSIVSQFSIPMTLEVNRLYDCLLEQLCYV